MYQSEVNKKIGLAQAAATRQAGLDAKQAALINAASTAYQTNVERVFKDLATQEKNALTFQLHPEQLWQQAREQVYNSMPEVTRNLINLQAPVAPAAPVANVPPAAPAAKVNPAMPSAPVGQMRWDPTANGGKGALVAAQPS